MSVLCLIGETGASCYNVQLKLLFVKSMLDGITFIIRVNTMCHAIDIPQFPRRGRL